MDDVNYPYDNQLIIGENSAGASKFAYCKFARIV